MNESPECVLLGPLMYPKEIHYRPTTSWDRLTKFRGREVKNILMDLDESFNQPMHSSSKDHPPMMHHHPFYSPSSRCSSSSRSSSQRSLIRRYRKRRRRCEWSCCCKVTLGLIILILLTWGTAVPFYFLRKFLENVFAEQSNNLKLQAQLPSCGL